MKIVVAGDGAGKTTKMADIFRERHKKIDSHKNIYVITYTNSAKESIKDKLIEINGNIPQRVFVETIHSFLLNELIYPFHHLLYEEIYTSASQMKLPDKPAFKNIRFKELREAGIIHVDKVTEASKWIVSGKSNDRKKIKLERQKVLSFMKNYMDSIFIDEAQDMDDNLKTVIEKLSSLGVFFQLVGDPKQDLRGYGVFAEMIEKYPEKVTYKEINYRSPQKHLDLSNLYVAENQTQRADSSVDGELSYVFQKDIDTREYLDLNEFDYIYIRAKNKVFSTNKLQENILKENLLYELERIFKTKSDNREKVKLWSFQVKKVMIDNLDSRSNHQMLIMLEKIVKRKLSPQERARLHECFDKMKEQGELGDNILVSSIDRVKGLEGDNCLFILTTDLAPYFFKENQEDNKMKNYLYVALTRSKNKLVILTTTEVEEKYGRQDLVKRFKAMNITHLKSE